MKKIFVSMVVLAILVSGVAYAGVAGIWKNLPEQEINLYIQTYTAGSGLAIVTKDGSEFWVFLDGDIAEDSSIAVAEYFGKNANITLNFLSDSLAMLSFTAAGETSNYSISRVFEANLWSADDNILQEGCAGWEAEVTPDSGVSANIRCDSGSIVVMDIVSFPAGGKNWNAQVKQVFDGQLQAGARYQVSFWIKTTLPKFIISLEQVDSPWANAGLWWEYEVGDGGEWKQYSRFFTADGITGKKKLTFQIGYGLGQFQLKEVKLEKLN